MLYTNRRGIVQGHSKGKVPSIPDFTTINISTNKLVSKINDATDGNNIKDGYLMIAIDRIGIKVTNNRSMDEKNEL